MKDIEELIKKYLFVKLAELKKQGKKIDEKIRTDLIQKIKKDLSQSKT
jgi:hypothetical protein